MHDIPATTPSAPQVVFLDRDGVINKDSPGYIKGRHDFEFLPGSLMAIEQLHAAGYVVIVITNQSAVSRRLISVAELQHIHQDMIRTVSRSGGLITDVFYCPHHPDDKCDCRKPATGLIRMAQQKYTINLAAATMIGDSAKDMECALNAGCGRRILVRTGNGPHAEIELSQRGIRVDAVVQDLLEAVHWILARDASR